MSSVQLGPFQLERPLGKGGMGEVWLGRHQSARHDVAVKVLTSEAARNERYRRAFRREVQAMARLNHPNIALIIDRGVVSAQAGAASGGRFVAGSPFLAMEYVDGPTLDGLIGKLDWPSLRDIVLQLLDALAHAHALEVIHRDLKPSNVLVANAAETLSVRLVDFGISAGFGDDEPISATEHTTGTPKYMAPEQVLGKRRDQGPWTDLYALGCVAWKMACGAVPFTGPNEAILRAHLDEALPQFTPQFALPDGFDAWLGRMLAKDHRQRFRRAADAAHALLSLQHDGPEQTTDEPDDRPLVERMTAGPDEPTATMHTLVPLTATIRVDTDSYARSETDSSAASGADLAPEAAPVPQSWRGAEPLRRSMELTGASLGMYGLRIIPVVDRDGARDLLWEQLVDVVRTGQARLTLLRGPAGYGKTRLARWLARRAHEVGAADILEATHSPMGSPTDGLAPMVARYLGCSRLEPMEAFRRVRELYTFLGVEGREAIVEPAAVTELLNPQATRELDQAAAYSFTNAQERYSVITQLLRRLAARRPLVVVLDDLQWSHEALGFVRHVLETDAEEALAVHLVVTVGDNVVDAPENLAAQLADWQRDARVSMYHLAPLADVDQRALVAQLLRLQPQLADEVIARSAGNPMFAIETVGDWIMQDLLAAGADGFQRRDEASASVPDDLHHVWRQRLEHFLGSQPDASRKAARVQLEIAAALGGDVSLDEWERVCRREGLPPDDALVDALFERGLATRTEGGWSATSQLLVDVLEQSARAHQRWTRHHAESAAVLAEMHPEHTRGLHRRLGEHHATAGQLDAALDELRLAVEEARDFGEHDQAEAILLRRERLVEDAGLDADDRRRVQNWLLREKLDVQAGDFDAAAERVERALEVAARNGYDYERGFALVEKGVLLSHAGERDSSLDVYRQATAIFERLGQRDRLARAVGELGVGYHAAGDYDRAVEAMQRAAGLFEQLGNRSMLAQCLVHESNIHASQGDFDDADRCLERALSITEQIGNQRLLGECYFYTGEAARIRGDLEEARRCFLQSAAIYKPIDRHNPYLARLGVAITEVQLGNFARAEALFERLLRQFRQTGQAHYECFTLAGLLCGAAHRHDWDAWDAFAETLDEKLARARVVDHGLRTLAETAARLAEGAGEDSRAAFARALADDQREALGLAVESTD